MDNFRTNKRQWRSHRPYDQQQRGRQQYHVARRDDTLKVVLKKDSFSYQRIVFDNHSHWSEPKPVFTRPQDKFHWSKPKSEVATATKQKSSDNTSDANKKIILSCDTKFVKKEFRNVSSPPVKTPNVQLSDRPKPKADVSQLAGFLKKPSNTSEANKKTSLSCDTKPVKKEYRNVSRSPIKEKSCIQDSVRCDIKDRAVSDPATKHSCLKADKKSLADDDFDYSLDLMGEYTLKSSDLSKKPTPFWFEAGQTTCYVPSAKQPASPTPVCKTSQDVTLDTIRLFPEQFTPEVDLGIVLDMPQDHGEYDIIMNSKRGYTYINYSRHRGIKRRISYDDEEENLIPHKRPRI